MKVRGRLSRAAAVVALTASLTACSLSNGEVMVSSIDESRAITDAVFVELEGLLPTNLQVGGYSLGDEAELCGDGVDGPKNPQLWVKQVSMEYPRGTDAHAIAAKLAQDMQLRHWVVRSDDTDEKNFDVYLIAPPLDNGFRSVAHIMSIKEFPDYGPSVEIASSGPCARV